MYAVVWAGPHSGPQLEVPLRSHPNSFRRIAHAGLKFDNSGRSTGVAFVAYKREADAKRAMQEFDGAPAKGAFADRISDCPATRVLGLRRWAPLARWLTTCTRSAHPSQLRRLRHPRIRCDGHIPAHTTRHVRWVRLGADSTLRPTCRAPSIAVMRTDSRQGRRQVSWPRRSVCGPSIGQSIVELAGAARAEGSRLGRPSERARRTWLGTWARSRRTGRRQRATRPSHRRRSRSRARGIHGAPHDPVNRSDSCRRRKPRMRRRLAAMRP